MTHVKRFRTNAVIDSQPSFGEFPKVLFFRKSSEIATTLSHFLVPTAEEIPGKFGGFGVAKSMSRRICCFPTHPLLGVSNSTDLISRVLEFLFGIEVKALALSLGLNLVA